MRFCSVRETEESTDSGGKTLGDGEKAEDAEHSLLLSHAEEVDCVGLRQYLNPVLSDLLAIDPSIPSSTESKSST